jgi:hypothetical protein
MSFIERVKALRRIISTPWFALADLALVLLSGCLWLLTGSLACLTIALLPWIVRSLAGSLPFRRTSLDWFILLFFMTSWLGYWAAYDHEMAWSKIWFIFLAVLLYYALAGQPTENLTGVCIFFFCLGVGVAAYFFLTLGIGSGLQLAWPHIHQNYAAGFAAITTPFVLYPIQQSAGKRYSAFLLVFAFLGLGVALLAILAATSRGIVMAIVSVGGAWMIWQVVIRNQRWTWLQNKALFPSLILLYLCAITIFLYLGPANSGYVSTDYSYGTGSRAELVSRSIYLILDFPVTGGGLGAFPGLYSYYMLGIPFFNVPNSHNLFLDVAMEQGILGGLSFLAIFLVSIWNIAGAYVRQSQLIKWLTLSALVIAFVHGLVDNYLYNGSGSFFALALAGVSSAIQPKTARPIPSKNYLIFSSVMFVFVLFTVMNLNGLRAGWYANLGAVQMAKVELRGFPTNQWTEPSILPELEQANANFRSTLDADPLNRTANHRLGLISMLRGDFISASAYLEKAHEAAPHHRGIIKSLGYCYVWLGDMEQSLLFLRNIPEAKAELDVYAWWWSTQGQTELAQRALFISSKLYP